MPLSRFNFAVVYKYIHEIPIHTFSTYHIITYD